MLKAGILSKPACFVQAVWVIRFLLEAHQHMPCIWRSLARLVRDHQKPQTQTSDGCFRISFSLKGGGNLLGCLLYGFDVPPTSPAAPTKFSKLLELPLLELHSGNSVSHQSYWLWGRNRTDFVYPTRLRSRTF